MAYLLGFLIGGIIFLLIFVIIGVIAWVLYGVSHSRALKHMGYTNHWAAWVPFYNFYALADCTGFTEFRIWNIAIPMNIFKWLWAGALIVGFVPVVGSVLMIIILVVYQGWCYGIIYATTENTSLDNTRVIGYVSGIITLIPIIKFFQLSKDVMN